MVAAAPLREAARRPRPIPSGITGSRLYGGQLESLDHNAEVRGARWVGEPGRIGIADKMEADPTVQRSHNTVIDPLIGAFWDVEPASDDPIDLEVANFVEWALFDLLPWERIVERVLTYLRFGFSLHEITADMRPFSRKRFPILGANSSRALVITGFHHRPAPTVHEWVPRERDAAQLARIIQWGPGSDAEDAGMHEVDASWLFRVTWRQEGGNFAGIAPARPQYGPWKAKTLCQVLEMIKHERTAVPTPTITLPDGQVVSATGDEVVEARAILADLRSHERGYAILPGGWKLELKTLDGDINETIKRCDQQIMLVFGSTYELLGDTASGSHALAGTQKTTQNVSIERHASVIASAINQGFDGWSLIERLVRPNYGPDVALPTFRCRALPTRDWTDIFKHMRNLGEIGFLTPGRVTERFVRWVSTIPQETMPYVAEGFRARMGVAANATDANTKEPAK